MSVYSNGEAVTKARMMDEDWYADYTLVCEVMCGGPDGAGGYYETAPGGFERAVAACRRAFEDRPGPLGWTPPDDARLRAWVSATWLTPVEIARVEAVRAEVTAVKTR